MILDCYRVKLQFLLAGLQSHIIYVRPGELNMLLAPESCELIGRTQHVNHRQYSDVQRQGYCERKLTIEVARKASILYVDA